MMGIVWDQRAVHVHEDQFHRGDCRRRRQSKWGNRIRQIEMEGGKEGRPTLLYVPALFEALWTKATTLSIRFNVLNHLLTKPLLLETRNSNIIGPLQNRGWEPTEKDYSFIFVQSTFTSQFDASSFVDSTCYSLYLDLNEFKSCFEKVGHCYASSTKDTQQ